MLEHLYGHSFGLEATRSFRFTIAQERDADIGADGMRLDHAGLLRTLAVMRHCAAAAARPRPGLSIAAWRSVSIVAEQPAAPPADPDIVGVRLVDAGRPLGQADLTFWRLPHSGCNARTDVNGSASCRLEDSQGHLRHPGFDSAPIIATYPGRVAAELVMLPTTRIIPR